MRKILMLVALLAMTAPVCAQSHFLRGDTNNDGGVDIGDALYLLSNLFAGGPDPICNDSADANDDGGKDIGDAVYLLTFLFQGGAAPEAPYPNWELDPTPDSIDCKGTVVIHSGMIAADETWSSTETHVLSGQVEVPAGVTLTIEAGTTVLGESATNGFLLVNQGVLIANGTALAPIVFTSENPVGSRSTADWGGVLIIGSGRNNWPDGIGQTEGVVAPYGTQGAACGGTTGTPCAFDETTSNGSMRYVRIEFGGTDISPNNEVNALSMFSVNDTTTFEFIQVKQNLDDGFEWFGGTASLKYGLATGIGDDKFDYSFGWAGKGQFWVGHDYDNFTIAGKPDNGFEVDNREDAAEYEFEPVTNPEISNVTMIGDPTGDSDHAFNFRRGAAGTVINAYAEGWTDSILDIDDVATTTAGSGGELISFSNNVAFNNASPNLWDLDGDEEPFSEDLWFLNGNMEAGMSQVVQANADLGAGQVPNFRPVAGGMLVGTATDPAAFFGGSFFDSVDYIGGVAPTGSDWTQASWVSYQVD
ncbi:MAG: hypothetical protein AAF488_09270 [Planctomycetota bacterium]